MRIYIHIMYILALGIKILHQLLGAYIRTMGGKSLFCLFWMTRGKGSLDDDCVISNYIHLKTKQNI